MNFRVLKKTSGIVLMLGLSAGLFYLCFRRVDLRELGQAFGEVRLIFLAPALFATFAILFLKTWQWEIFLGPSQGLRFSRLFQVVSLWLMMVNLLPFWFGEAFLLYLLGKREGLGKTRTFSGIALDQLCEGSSLLAVFALLLFSAPLPGGMREAMRGVVVLISVFFVVLLSLAHRYRNWEEKEPPLGFSWARLRHHFAQWANRLSVLRSVPKMLAAIFLSLCVKSVEAVAIFFLQKGFGLSLPFWTPFLVIAALNLALMIPLAPGNLGIFEATVFFIYRFLGVDSALALSLAILYHLVYALPLIGTGYFFSWKWGVKGWRRQEVLRSVESEG